MMLLKIQVLQSVNFLLFSLYFTHCFVFISELSWPTRCTFCCTGSQISVYISHVGFMWCYGTSQEIQPKNQKTGQLYPSFYRFKTTKEKYSTSKYARLSHTTKKKYVTGAPSGPVYIAHIHFILRPQYPLGIIAKLILKLTFPTKPLRGKQSCSWL